MHVKSLDGARGIAAALVAVDHFILIAVDPAADSTLHLVAAGMGSFGVGLFFLISGFVIPQTLRRGSWDYAARRVFRIYPVAFAGAGLGLLSAWITEKDNGTFWLTVTLVGNLHVDNTELLRPIYWTLTIEVAFYVLAGIIGRCTSRGADGRTVYYVLLGVLAAIVVVMKAEPAGSTPLRVGLLVILCCWPMLCMGWFAFLLRAGHIDQPLFLLGAGAALGALSTGVYPYFEWRLGAPTWLAALAVFSVLVFGRGRSLPAPVSRALSALGLVTFSLYVVHVPVLDVVHAQNWSLAPTAAAYVVITAVLSVVVHWVAEKPGIVAGKWLAGIPHRRAGAVVRTRPVAPAGHPEPATAVLTAHPAAPALLPPVPVLDRAPRRREAVVAV